MDKISLDRLLTLTSQPSISNLSDNPDVLLEPAHWRLCHPLGLLLFFFCFMFISIHYHTQNQKKNKNYLRWKINYNIYVYKPNPLHKIFNRNTIKLSYSCMPSVRTIISNHNKSELNKPEQTDVIKNCNCWNSKTCPMDANRIEQGIVY